MIVTDDELYRGQIKQAFEHLNAGEYDRALDAAITAMKTNPAGAEAIYALGLTATRLNDLGRAVTLIEEAHRFDPDCREYVDALAAILPRIGRLNDSLYYAKVATAASPHPWLAGMVPPEFSDYWAALMSASPAAYHLMAYNEFGNGEFAKAVELAERGLRVDARNVDAYRILGRALFELDEADRAISALQAAAHIEPLTATDLLYLGDSLLKLGRFAEARAVHRRMVLLEPESAETRSRSLARLAYYDDETWTAFPAEQAAWNAAFGSPEDPNPPPEADRFHSGRPIRVGYLIRAHATVPEIRLVEAALKHFNTRKFEVFCYQQAHGDDVVATELRAGVDDWRDIYEIDDETVAAIVNGDEIDILVDTIGHGDGSRLSVFAYRPAPVQVSWLGSPPGAGAVGIDYVLSDAATAAADRAAAGDVANATLEGGLVAYAAADALAQWPEPTDLPALRQGHVTFGGICDLRRLTPETAALWADALRAVDGALLTLGGVKTIPDAARDHALSLFADFGAADRVVFQTLPAGQDPMRHLLANVDIMLDTVPVNGTIDTCRALWMGVPVLTRAGTRRAACMGASLLTAAGKPEWAAKTDADFIRIAAGLAADPETLARTRESLRGALGASRLCNAEGFVLSLETAYEKMWTERKKASA